MNFVGKILRFSAIVGLLIPLLPNVVEAGEQISNERLYQRCYGHFVRNIAPETDPLLIQVKAGTLSPEDACSQLLDQALLTASSNTQIANTSDAVQKSIIKTFHDFHASWFPDQRFQGLNDNCGDTSTGDIFDASQPAAYITRAMFHGSTEYKNVLNGTSSFRPVRTDMDPTTGPHSGFTKASMTHYYGDRVNANTFTPTLAGKGEMIGIEANPSLQVPETAFLDIPNYNMKASLGGGILGDPAFLLMSIKEDGFPLSDGAVKMPRKWARAVYDTLLCRELPVVRLGDGNPWVSEAAEAPFRKSNSCIKCHVSMDRMAAIHRGVLFDRTSDGSCTNSEPVPWVPVAYPPDQPATSVWPLTSDANYFRTPIKGVLYYRSYDGKLVHSTVSSLDDMGTAITDQNDFYVCAAKRYYEFLTGVDANINDIDDPFNPVTLNTVEKRHRNEVIKLGKSLKKHQNLRRLIKEIVSTEWYSTDDFGTIEVGDSE